MTVNETKNKTKKFSVPPAFALMTFMIFIAVVLSWIVPAGSFDRAPNASGTMMVVPGTYHEIANKPASVWDGFTAIPRGLAGSASIIFAVFLIGASFTIIERSGAIQSSLSKVTKLFHGKELLMIPIIMAALSAMCCFIGLLELSMVIIPIMIPICLALGFDTLTAVAIPLIATAAGFGAAVANPFTVVVAQGIGELPLYSGAAYRTVCIVIITIVGILYVLRYAKKVRQTPTSSIMYERDKELLKENAGVSYESTGRRKLALLVMIAGFIAIIIGAMQYKWGLTQISTTFIIMGVVIGAITGQGIEGICSNFSAGLSIFSSAAMVSGFARAITIILEDSSIIDTIVYYIANAVQACPSSIAAVAMLVFQTFFNFIVPSGSGQALITMPIMLPLSDLIGVSRQTAILAYQFGDGFSNILWPTLGYLWACIGFAKIKYEEWFKFILPLILLWYVVSAILVFVAHAIQWA
ncbi:MAG: AbgT family transporter [Synergistaceae bacterium]|jgi:uncharacterized ion transporter superfamily protein YfcC|nr:AbgT family transporter [Synergistaceae bacterium]